MQYVFKCRDCEKEFEIVASFSTIMGLTTNCPVCKSKNIKRIYTPLNFILRDKGFYKTDSREDIKNG